MRLTAMPGMDEDERTRSVFGEGTWTYQVALMAKRELTGISFGRHWAIGLFHAQGNIVLHTRNWELGDSFDLCGGPGGIGLRSSSQKQLRITSWPTSKFVAYRGIVFKDSIAVDLDTLREMAWGLYSDVVGKQQNCQDFSLGLLQALGVTMVGWLQRADCFNSSGNIVSIPLREKKSIFNPLKLMSLGILNRLSSAHWDDCSCYFNRMVSRLSRTWQPHDSPSAHDGACCVCLGAPREYACVPCGHLCLCEQCSTQIQLCCPMCRTVVRSCIRIYH